MLSISIIKDFGVPSAFELVEGAKCFIIEIANIFFRENRVFYS